MRALRKKVRCAWMTTLALVVAVATSCVRNDDGHGHGHGGGEDHDAHHEEVPRGPHGGRLFTASGVQLEILIEEADTPPVLLAWVYDEHDVLTPPDQVQLTAQVHRFGDRLDTLPFLPMGQHLRSDGIVREPHSFRCVFELNVEGREYAFTWEQREFRVDLDPAAVTRAGIRVGEVGAAEIAVEVEAPGEVRLNRERVLIARPRFPGVVTEMRKHLGDAVQAGEVLAVIQSNNSLTEYTITATMDGHIVARSGMVGAAVDGESELYTVADLSSVWVDFAIYPQHVGVVKRGQPVVVRSATQRGLEARGVVAYVGPLLEADTRVSHGRIVLPNPQGVWQPGLYVNVVAVVQEGAVPLAVPDAAVVRSKFGPAVFLADGSSFEIQPVTLGRTDGKFVEVVEGLRAGDAIVVENTYLLKAELGRAEATHDH